MKINYKLIIGIIAIYITGITGLIIIKTNYRKDKIPTETNSDTVAIKRVHNLIILDESGSMSGLEKVSIGGVNETIRTIKEAYIAKFD